MKSRPTIILELEDSNNNIGYGEVWCNFPSDGANYRFNVLKNIFSNFIIDCEFTNPQNYIKHILGPLKTVFVQSDDIGTYNNISAAFDCAIWDLFAKVKQIPLNKLLNPNANKFINVYASGINPNDSIKQIQKARLLGINAFKIKIGFNDDLDLNLINLLNNHITSKEILMLDVNQGWSIDNSKKFLNLLANKNIYWVEEPISARTQNTEYLSLAKSTQSKLALGENINEIKDFIFFLKSNYFNFVQPDITKFGGISLIKELIELNEKEKIWLHFLGSGVGLLTSGHLMTAFNPNGLLETDVNLNPLRTNIFEEELKIENGKIELSEKSGIGMKLNFNTINKYLVSSLTL